MNLLKIAVASAFGLTALHASAMPVESISASTLDSNSVEVSWSAAEGALYYELYQNSSLVQTGIVETSVVVDGLIPATAYQFFVTACDADGTCSQSSSQADVSTAATTGSTGGGSVLGICEPATDGSAPTVALADNGDGTATGMV